MRKCIVVFSVLILAGMAVIGHEGHDDEAAIRKVIESAYRDGLCNRGDVEAVRAGFHPEFRLLGIRDDKMWVLPIARWIEMTEKKKAEGKFPPEKPVAMQFPMIDITGTAAVVKVKFYRGKELAYTDYLSLYKFKEGWKIVNKIFHTHR